MKFLIFVAVLMAVCGQSSVDVQADVIKCKFEKQRFYDEDGDLYTCFIKSIQQDENQNVIIGNHEIGKSDDDVGVVYLYSLKDFDSLTKFNSIFCQKFPNLEKFEFDSLQPASLVENSLHDCSNLNYVEFINADIKQIPENLFSNNLKLTFLTLKKNRLVTLPENIFLALEKLEQLHLSDNQLNYLPANVFKSLVELKTLSLENNKLSTLNPRLFDNLRNLELLTLSSNNIKNLPKNIFIKLEKLKELSLCENNLVTIHADLFGKKPQLENVYVCDNQIASIDEKFIDDTAVTRLDMENNTCSQEYFISRDKLKKSLQQCFVNYQPRQVS